MSPWTHVYSSYLGQWLPGDQRGFNSRHHKIRSTRHYLIHDPFTKEHAGLERYSKLMCDDKVSIARQHRPMLLEALRAKFESMGTPIAAIGASPTHTHALIKVGDEDAKPIFGRAKQAASHALRAHYPGRLWGASCGVRRIMNFGHFASALWYILDHEKHGAAVWCDPDIERSCREHYPDWRDKYSYSLEDPEVRE
jgi:REP element-mobilizing transposase RayT